MLVAEAVFVLTADPAPFSVHPQGAPCSSMWMPSTAAMSVPTGQA